MISNGMPHTGQNKYHGIPMFRYPQPGHVFSVSACMFLRCTIVLPVIYAFYTQVRHKSTTQ